MHNDLETKIASLMSPQGVKQLMFAHVKARGRADLLQIRVGLLETEVKLLRMLLQRKKEVKQNRC